ncbi:hypothetical protein B0J18DRAFT_469383 [Chaetomium sp. MPI-SDFR-AT-0129]|nr:hypothetical protein B0J18DRAFT_469383 [Chaetomium sp. MPI-SDFR-AT-0129]
MEEDFDNYYPHQPDTCSVDEDSRPSEFDEERERGGDEVFKRKKNKKWERGGGEVFKRENNEEWRMPALEHEIIDLLLENNIDLGTAGLRSYFPERYTAWLSSTAQSRPAEWRFEEGWRPQILHRIAELPELVHTTPIVRLLLGEFPGLAEGRGKHGKTALHVALGVGNLRFVQAMMDMLETLDDIVNIQDNEGMNCIHAAVVASIPHSLILDLVRRTPADVLRVQNDQGLTPLHLAVRYDRCATVGQLKLVEELLHRAPKLSQYEGESNRRQLEMGAARIRDTLNLWVLRKRGEDEARRLLYGSNPKNIQVSFKLGRHSQEALIPASDFEEGYGSIRFDSMLSLVSLGEFRIQEANQKVDLNRRRDALFIFSWLRKKGIERVLKVVVEDLTSPSHGDESIEESLRDLQVERLD